MSHMYRFSAVVVFVVVLLLLLFLLPFALVIANVLAKTVGAWCLVAAVVLIFLLPLLSSLVIRPTATSKQRCCHCFGSAVPVASQSSFSLWLQMLLLLMMKDNDT